MGSIGEQPIPIYRINKLTSAAHGGEKFPRVKVPRTTVEVVKFPGSTENFVYAGEYRLINVGGV